MQHLTLEREEGILVVTLSRGKANALNCEMVDELQQALNHAAADDRTHGVVITSATAEDVLRRLRRRGGLRVRA